MTTPREAASAHTRKGAATARRRRDPLVKVQQERAVVAGWTAGRSPSEIADDIGVSVETVRRIRRDALDTALGDRDVEVARMRETELRRLDGVQAAFWQRAQDGSVGAAKVVLDCIRERAKLGGLYAPVKVDARVRSELDAQIEALMEDLAAKGLAKIPAE